MQDYSSSGVPATSVAGAVHAPTSVATSPTVSAANRIDYVPAGVPNKHKIDDLKGKKSSPEDNKLNEKIENKKKSGFTVTQKKKKKELDGEAAEDKYHMGDIVEEIDDTDIKKKVDFSGVCVGLVIISILLVAIIVPLKLKEKNTTVAEFEEGYKRPELKFREKPIKELLQYETGFDDLHLNAMEWIVYHDPLLLDPEKEENVHQIVQRYALMVVYCQNNGKNWLKQDNWKSRLNECEWEGVSCIDEIFVSKLDLESNLLTENLRPEISLFSRLQDLNLQKNDMIGSVPELLWKLTDLQSLQLKNNKFVGNLSVVPFENLPYLINLDLSFNHFSDEISLNISQAINLERLILEGNKFEGEILSYVTNLTKLKSLRLQNNKFHGIIPEEISNLSNLVDLELNQNEFAGKIPAEITSLKSIEHLGLALNDFQGPIPNDIYRLSNLKFLNLENNFKLGGSIPPTIGELSDLLYLNVASCSLTGEIPSSVGNSLKMDTLNLFSNKLEGTVPNEFSQLVNLRVLLLHFNQLTGSIPSGLCQLRSDETLWRLEADCSTELTCPDECCTRCGDSRNV